MSRTLDRILLVVILMSILLFSGCRNVTELVEEESVRADAEALMNAIETKDSEYIYDTYFSHISKLEFDSEMNQIYEVYKGERIKTELYNVQAKIFNQTEGDKKSESSKAVIYIIETTQSTYTLKLSYYKEGDEVYALVGANVAPFTNYVVNEKIRDYNAKTWIIFSLNVVSYGIMILALILCIKTKIKMKPLWIILILLQVGVSITDFPDRAGVNYSFIQLLGVSGYYLFAHGGTITNLYVHIFAILFLFLRKGMSKNYLRTQRISRANDEYATNSSEKLIEETNEQQSLLPEDIDSNEQRE